MTENKPVKTFRSGGVKASVWKNTTEKNGQSIEFYNVSVTRSYKDKDGNWQETNNYTSADLPKLSAVARLAFDHLNVKEDQ